MGWVFPSVANPHDSRCKILHSSPATNAVGITGILWRVFKITSKCLPLFTCRILDDLSLPLVFCLYFLFSLPSLILLPGKHRQRLSGDCNYVAIPSLICGLPNCKSQGLGGVPSEKEMEKKNWKMTTSSQSIKPSKIQLTCSKLNHPHMLWH